MFDTKEINGRFFSLFQEKSRAEMAALLRVSQGSLSEWATGKKRVPWRKLALARELSGKSWDWLLEGAEGVSVEKMHGDGINGGKKDAADMDIVETLTDHIETLKRQNDELRREKEELKAEVGVLREENRQLLALSSGKATRRAGSA